MMRNPGTNERKRTPRTGVKIGTVTPVVVRRTASTKSIETVVTTDARTVRGLARTEISLLEMLICGEVIAAAIRVEKITDCVLPADLDEDK